MIRIFDIVASALGLILLSPVFLIVAVCIKIDDWSGPVFYQQKRVGKDGVDFGLYKFRSMYVGSDKKGLITIGGRDPRITRAGYYIRKFKLDELPQLINVLKGDMSIVGPRPEVRKYVDMYTPEQRHVLDVRPGITDYASIEYLDENALLALSSDPDKTYVEEVMPAKIKLNMRFIHKPTLANYLNIILITFLGISVSKFVNWYFTKKALTFWEVVAIDLCVAFAAYMGAYAIVEGTVDFKDHLELVIATILICYLPIYLVTGKYLHTFDIKLRYTNNKDLQKVVASMLIGTVGNLILKSFIPYDEWLWPVNVKTILLGAALATLLMIMVRIISRGMYESKLTEVNLPRAVLYGTPENMEFIAQILQNQTEHPFAIYGFMTNELTNSKYRVWGKKTYVKDANVVKELVKHDVTYLICGPSMSESIRKDKVFMDQLTGAGIKVLVSLQLSTLGEDGTKNSKLNFRKIEIEDLLARDQLDVDLDAIGKKLERKSVLITGVGGSIGLEIVKQVADLKPRLMLLVDIAETPLHNIMLMMQEKWPDQDYLPFVTSVTSERLMENIFMNYRPDYVFHAASYNRVPVVEISPAYAVQNNCMGTRIMADLSVKYGVKKFVLISTDKAVKPTSVMGCSKRISEIYCQALNGNEKANPGKTQFVTARIGDILGKHSSVLHIFREQIKKGGPVTVTDKYIARYFILAHEACKLMLQAGTMGHGGEIFVFDMGDPIRVDDIAHRMINMSGAKNVKIEYTGLRHGEKIYEDVISEDEELVPTDHRMIKIVKGVDHDFEEVKRNEMELEDLSYSYDDMAVLVKMKEIVPDYKSYNLNVTWDGNDNGNVN